LPAGLDFTGHVLPAGVVGGGVVGGRVVGGGVVGGGVVGGRVVGGALVGGVPSQAPRSRHSEGVAAGFQPAPGGGVWATNAWYWWPL
jgi:hypothetical protein